MALGEGRRSGAGEVAQNEHLVLREGFIEHSASSVLVHHEACVDVALSDLALRLGREQRGDVTTCMALRRAVLVSTLRSAASPAAFVEAAAAASVSSSVVNLMSDGCGGCAAGSPASVIAASATASAARLSAASARLD